MEDKKYRLVTKADFDGLGCGILLKEIDLIDSIEFCHPKDLENGKTVITERDITAGLPYKESVHLAFDYYPGALKTGGKTENLIVDVNMPSSSRVIYKHFGSSRFTNIPHDMLDAVDKGFSANISIDEILYPTGWILLNYLVDQRTGLEAFGKFSVPHNDYILNLIDSCRKYTIWEVLDTPDVEERLNLYFPSIERCKEQILRCSSVHYNLVVSDLRNEKIIYPGNRFMVYAMFPECNVSLQITALKTPDDIKTIFVIGKSILDRSFDKDIGSIMRKFGGGGHSNAGSCQAKGDDGDRVLDALIMELKYTLFKNIFMGYFNY